MTVTAKVLIPAKIAENTQTTQYTATGVTTIIDKFTATNYSDTASTLVMQGGTSTNFLGAGSDIITGNNICESPNSTTLLRNTGGQYDLPMGYAPVVVAGATHTLNPQAGGTRFIDTVSVTTGITMSIVVSSYAQASFSEIALEIINTSGGTTAITFTSSFVFQTAFTQLTSGQRTFLKFAYDGATAKWYQTASQITVTS